MGPLLNALPAKNSSESMEAAARPACQKIVACTPTAPSQTALKKLGSNAKVNAALNAQSTASIPTLRDATTTTSLFALLATTAKTPTVNAPQSTLTIESRRNWDLSA